MVLCILLVKMILESLELEIISAEYFLFRLLNWIEDSLSMFMQDLTMW